MSANGGILPFNFTGNTGGTGVGGNATTPTTPVFSFVVQPGLYQLVFNTNAQWSPIQTGQLTVQARNGLNQISGVVSTGLEAIGTSLSHVATGQASVLWRVTSQNQTPMAYKASPSATAH